MNLKSKQFASIIPGRPNAIEVNYDITSALRQYKKMQKQSNIIVDLYDRKFYLKPSVRNRKMMKNARYIQLKQSEKE